MIQIALQDFENAGSLPVSQFWGTDGITLIPSTLAKQITATNTHQIQARLEHILSARELWGLHPRQAAADDRSKLARTLLIRKLPQVFKGKAPAALTSPKEKLVCRSLTLGRLINTSRANWLKVFRSLLTTCSSKVPVPLM